jgi:hypothetical protein
MTSKSKSTSSTTDLTTRLGPVRKVVKMTKAAETEASYHLHLECKHVRVGTKRKSLRCGRCRK